MTKNEHYPSGGVSIDTGLGTLGVDNDLVVIGGPLDPGSAPPGDKGPI